MRDCFNETPLAWRRTDELLGTWPQLTPAPNTVLLCGRLRGSIMHHGGLKYFKVIQILGRLPCLVRVYYILPR